MAANSQSALVKENLASHLREAIVERRLRPGERVIESEWALEFGVAQASVREAINLLIMEGFLVKSAGRSARVPQYTREDVARIFEVRGALEGLAAQLAAAAHADLTPMESALAGMELASAEGNVKELVKDDLAFHLALADASGNPLLANMLGRLLRPLFTFVLIRMMETNEDTWSWLPDLPRHQQMIYLIRHSEPALAGQFVQHCMSRFVFSAQTAWLPEALPKRRRKK